MSLSHLLEIGDFYRPFLQFFDILRDLALNRDQSLIEAGSLFKHLGYPSV